MADSCCGKTIDVRALEAEQRRVLVVVLVLNAVTFLVMIAAAWQSGSSSLPALQTTPTVQAPTWRA